MLKRIAKECNRLKINVYLVGGPVRDLFLGKSNIDMDIVVDKDVKIILPVLAKELSARSTYHSKFKTAKLYLKKGDLIIDLATAREEFYPFSGSLPQVFPATLEKDLFRRDFTINAMAIKIEEKGLSYLIDPYKGMEDLKGRKIRVLHEKSFLDDPTRIIRAIRFASRLNFDIEERTLSLLKEAVDESIFSRVSSSRIGNEVIKILQEEDPLKGIRKLKELRILNSIHPKFSFDIRWDKVFPEVSEVSGYLEKITERKIEKWIVYFTFLTERLDIEDLEKIFKEYELKRNERLYILHARRLEEIVDKKEISKSNYSIVYNKLKPIFLESLIYLSLKGDEVFKEKILDFLCKFCKVRLYTDGEKLKKMGFSPGPIFNKILGKLFLAKLDGIISTSKGEIKFIKDNFLSR